MQIRAYDHFIGLDNLTVKDNISKDVTMHLVWHLYQCKLNKVKCSSSISSITTPDPTKFIPFRQEGLRFLQVLNKKHKVEVLNLYDTCKNDMFDLLYVSPKPIFNDIHGLSFEHLDGCKLKSIDGFEIDNIYVNVKTISQWVYVKYYKIPFFHDKILIFCKRYADVFKCIEFLGKFSLFMASIKYLGFIDFIKQLCGLQNK